MAIQAAENVFVKKFTAESFSKRSSTYSSSEQIFNLCSQYRDYLSCQDTYLLTQTNIESVNYKVSLIAINIGSKSSFPSTSSEGESGPACFNHARREGLEAFGTDLIICFLGGEDSTLRVFGFFREDSKSDDLDLFRGCGSVELEIEDLESV